MIRIRLEYVRQKRVIEKGYVMVDVDEMATLGDVYAKAYEKQFAEKLAKEEDVVADDWDFKIETGQQYESAPPPRPA
jgi:hypothetical protein